MRPFNWRVGECCLLTIAAIGFVFLACPPSAHAQVHREGWHEASFTAGVSLGDGNAALASTAALGIRVSGRLGMAIELAHARKLDFQLDLCPPPLVCVRGDQLPVTGRTVSLVPLITFDLLRDPDRLRAYIVAGVGAGHVRERYFDDALVMGDRFEYTRSSLTAAIAFGGGAMLALSRRLAVGADVRSLHLLDDEARPERFITPSGTLSTVRIGSRVTWGF